MNIPFPGKERQEYFKLLETVFDSSFWSEGSMVKEFEGMFGKYTGTKALAVTNGGSALLALLEYALVQGGEVIVPPHPQEIGAFGAALAALEATRSAAGGEFDGGAVVTPAEAGDDAL